MSENEETSAVLLVVTEKELKHTKMIQTKAKTKKKQKNPLNKQD